ncbi:MAG: diguanylate cyclase domain-containing protein, partial [Oscillospiraceae bacterium]
YDKDTFRQICVKCSECGVPVVSVDELLDNSLHIGFDYGEAFGEIVEHVLTVHSCKRIKLIAGIRGNDFSQTRIDSCRRVMARHGITLEDKDIMYGEFWEQPTFAAMDKFFASGEALPDAFICCNDSMAIAVCQKLNEHGLNVPDDVIVTGFDGIEMEKYHRPRLCTAARDNGETADAILELAERIMGGERIDSYEKKLLYKPVFSESCGCRKIDYGAGNNILIDYVRGFTYIHTYKEHVDRMENRIAADSSLEHVRSQIRKCGFGNSVMCITERLHSFYMENTMDEDSYKSAGYPQKMRVFVNTTESEENREGLSFSSDELLPDITAAAGDNHIAFVLPIHFQENNLGYMVTPYSPAENHMHRVSLFTISVNRCLETVRVREHMAMLNQRLSFLFTHDHLTGILNRYGFYESIRERMESHPQNEVFIVSADLNDMKYINDNFGHSAGDDALIITANTLTGAADGDEGIICSRFGGDEFVVAGICSDAHTRGEQYRKRFYEVLEKNNRESGYQFEVKISFGLYCASLSENEGIDSLIELADRLMYSDKAKYKRRPRNLPENYFSDETDGNT